MAILSGDEPEVLVNAEGARTTPSVVAYDADGSIVVGETARRQAATNPSGTVISVKRRMGDPSWAAEAAGKRWTAPEISAQILMKLKRDAEAYLGEPVTDAVITVPAYFNDAQRQATKDAGQIAGLDVQRIVNEPTAAALAYGLGKAKQDERILVYDLGGGTFDVSLLEVGKDDDGFSAIQVIATAGDNRLGGDDWDQRVVDWLVGQVKSKTGVDLSSDPVAMSRLKEAAEQAKKELSNATSTRISLQYVGAGPSGPVHVDEALSRAQFEDMTSDLLERTRAPFEQALRDGNVAVFDIDHVVLVGGSTRMPAVADLVEKLAGKEPSRGVNPDEVVAVGAALQGGVVSGARRDVILVDVTPLSLGIETSGGQMAVVIPRNTQIPARASQVFSTADDGQDSVFLQIYQGERPMTRDNKLLGDFELTGIPPAPRGVPQIEVTFEIDVNGIVSVSARDKATEAERHVKVTGGSGLPKAEIDRMTREAEEHAAEDRARLEEAETRSRAEGAAYSAGKLLRDTQASAPQDLREEVQRDLDALRAAIDAGDGAAIASAHDKLSQSSMRLGASMYA
jgi:molecular chaperone DnaK